MEKTLHDLRTAITVTQEESIPMLQQARQNCGSDRADFARCCSALNELSRQCGFVLSDGEITEALRSNAKDRSSRRHQLCKLHYWCSRLDSSGKFLPEVMRKCIDPRGLTSVQMVNAEQQLSAGVINLQHYLSAAQRTIEALE